MLRCRSKCLLDFSLGEGHMGNYINSYLKYDYSFDVHPPLGKLLLTYIAKRSKYNGSHTFGGIGRYVMKSVLCSFPPLSWTKKFQIVALRQVISDIFDPLANTHPHCHLRLCVW